METRANYVLIGACTLLAIVAALGFFIWLGQRQLDRQYDLYDVLFDSVSGLSRASEVRFNGLPVGQVVDLALYQDDPSKVRVRIEVAATTPVRTDTTAQLQPQGVTGVSYVSLDGGSPDAQLLQATVEGVPVIRGERSVVEELTEGAPDLLREALDLLRNLQAFIGPGNQAYVTSILSNLDRASGQLETALADFSTISRTIEQAAGQIGGFTGRLEQIGASAETVLGTADDTLKAARGAFTQAETTLAGATGALTSAESAFQGADAVIRQDVPAIVADFGAAIANLRTAVAAIDAETRGVLAKLDSAAGQADARLAELGPAIKSLDTTLTDAIATLAAVDSASQSFETLMEGDGTALVAEARAALTKAETSIAAIDRVVTEDVPVIVGEVRSATETASRVIEEVGADFTGFSGRLDPLTASADAALTTATATFRTASDTLGRLDTAIGTAEGTLKAAESAFTTADRIIGEEVAPTAADIRGASARLATAVEDIADDLPAVTEDLRATLARASGVVGQIDAVVARSAPQVDAFAANGLPQITRFAAEARRLVASLEAIAARLERDPARFFLGSQAPEYRR